MNPDHGASALPGATLPCGFPPHKTSNRTASCTVAINIKIPALRNPHTPTSKIPGMHPADIATAYGFSTSGTGFKVAVVDAYDNPRAESDMNKYRAKFGLGPCTTDNGCFTKVNQAGRAGHYPRANKQWAQESALDLAMVSAICPKCPIVLVEANSASIDDLGTAVDEAVTLGAKAVSNSYYLDEFAGETAYDEHYNHPGVAITVSAGDKAYPYYPAASPYVTSVGATTLSGGAETPWKYGGQGCSAYEPQPVFQTTTLCTTRATVDMAVVGDPQTGVTVYSTQNGGWIVVGGTSVGAPIVAAAYALSGNFAGPAYSYANSSGFRDLGTPGFDLATGLGAPMGVGGL